MVAVYNWWSTQHAAEWVVTGWRWRDNRTTTITADADVSQLYFHADAMVVDNKVRQLVACTEEISHWMSANRLKLNTDKNSSFG